MSSMYDEAHRGLQNTFGTRRLADRLEAMIVKDFMDEQDQGFVSTRDMFFLSTVDQYGRPTVSYKGGDPGFIKIIDDRRSRSRVMTETACTYRWATSAPIRRSASCSSILQSHTACACRAAPRFRQRIRWSRRITRPNSLCVWRSPRPG